MFWLDGQVHLHTTGAKGHLRSNTERDQRVCFEVDEHESVFDYGRFECDSGLAYPSVCLFGRIRIIDDSPTKQRFCEILMDKYGRRDIGRPKEFFPRLDAITVYAISAERTSGKQCEIYTGIRAVARGRRHEDP